MFNRAVFLGLILLAFAGPVPSSDEAQPAQRNYQIVFHTDLSGQSEDIVATIAEGDFHIKLGNPDIMISGNLRVTEDYMHRLEYQFIHELPGKGDEAGGKSPRYERFGSVILEPGEIVKVVDAPDVELGIELREQANR